MAVLDYHEEALKISAALTSFYVPAAIHPLDVVRALNEAKVSFVLAGAHAAFGWMREPRATEDVDVIVAVRQVKKAVKVLCETFPNLQAEDLPVVVRLRDGETKKVLIDVMKPLQQPYVEVFKNTHRVQVGKLSYRIPSLEMAIVMKFSAMTSLYRADVDKYQDAHDFILLVRENPELDEPKLKELGELIYSDGGKDVVEMARKARAGEKLNL